MHAIIEKGGNIDLVVIKRIDLMVFVHNCFVHSEWALRFQFQYEWLNRDDYHIQL